MPGVRCAVAACQNSSVKALKFKKSISFFTFPKDCKQRKIWINRCGRSNKFNPATSRVCSDHFHYSDFKRDLMNELLCLPIKRILKEEAVPSLLLAPGATVPSPSEREARYEKRKRKELVEQILNTCDSGNCPVSTTDSVDTNRGSQVSRSRIFRRYSPDLHKIQLNSSMANGTEPLKKRLRKKKSNDEDFHLNRFEKIACTKDFAVNWDHKSFSFQKDTRDIGSQYRNPIGQTTFCDKQIQCDSSMRKDAQTQCNLY